MKKILYLLGITLLLYFTSCTESFLDVEPQTSLSTDMAIGNFADAEVALMGVYQALHGSSAYYARDFVVTPDVAADDVFIAPENSGRFLQQFNYTTSPTTGFTAAFWNRAYDGINRTNNIIERIDLIDDATEEQINHLLGQALALRALMHFDLLRIYARPYSWDNGDSPGVPYMDQVVVSSPSRDPVAFVYQQVVNDLKEAYELMDARTGLNDRAYLSKYAAKALLARVYLYMEEWELAADYAMDVIENGGYDLVSADNYVDKWMLEFSSESIFSLAMSNIDYRSTDALGYIYLRAGYGDLRPTVEFMELLAEHGGVREEAFITFDIIAEDYFINKFPGRDNLPGLDNVPVIRLAEMYLIAAEALANLNRDDEARDHLNAVYLRANPDDSAIDLSGDELMERIYLEKRIEFAFEGHRLFDITRRKQDLERGETCRAQTCFVAALDFRFVFPIPQREMDANDNMRQNPGYGD